MPTLSSIVGHRRLTALLASAVARDTLPPTLLFSGPTGVGKFLTARALAACLNCLAPVGHTSGLAVDACGTCRGCDRIERGLHVDLFSIEPDERDSIKIDVIRDVLSRTGFRPFEGRRRVVIVRDADTLETASQSALLKSLEEPPDGTVFVMTTAVPGTLLPTVRSRCMRLRFSRLSETDVADALVAQHEFPPETARVAATLSDGSLGQALALASADVEALRETALLLLRQTARGQFASRLQAGTALATGGAKKERSRAEIALVLRLVASMLRDIEVLNAGGDVRVLANRGAADELGALTGPFAGDRARTAFSAVDRAIVALDRNAGTKVVSEWLATQI